MTNLNLIKIISDSDCGFNVWALVEVDGKAYDVELNMDLFTGFVKDVNIVDGETLDDKAITDFINHEINKHGLSYYGLGFIGANYKFDIEQNGSDTCMLSLANPTFVDDGEYHYIYTYGIIEIPYRVIDRIKYDEDNIYTLMNGLLNESEINRSNLKKTHKQIKEIYTEYQKEITKEQLIKLFKDEI